MSNSVSPWTVALQGPLFMEFSRQEYWSGLPFLLQGIFLTRGWNFALQADSLLFPEPPGKPRFCKSKFYAFPFSVDLGVEFFFYFSVLKQLQKLQAVAKIVQTEPMCCSPIFPTVRSYGITVQYQNGNWQLVQCLYS